MVSTSRIVNVTASKTLAVSAEVAVTAWQRFRGLLGRKSLASGEGLVIPNCSSIHMFFMNFPIDVLFVDAEHRVCALREHLKPFRIAWGGWRARHAVELPAGAIAATGTEVGHLISWQPPC